MATQLLFYKSPVAVNVTKHRDLCVRPGAGYGFAAGVNSVPLAAQEFGEASAIYPIVFAGDGEGLAPTAIVGINNDQNAYVDAEGKWTGSYVPAFVRRYPYVFSNETSDGQLVLHIDESYEGCNVDGRGERLFDSEGNQTTYLQNVLTYMQQFQAAFLRTQAFAKKLSDWDLLRPSSVAFTLADGSRSQLGGFSVVDREKLRGIEAGALEELFRTGELECIFQHLASLRHFASVAEATAGQTVTDSAGATDDATPESPADMPGNAEEDPDPLEESKDPVLN